MIFRENPANLELEIDDLQSRINWLEKGLKEIVNHYSYSDIPREVRNIAQSYLDGEPSTADEFNKEEYINKGDDIEYNFEKVGTRITFAKV